VLPGCPLAPQTAVIVVRRASRAPMRAPPLGHRPPISRCRRSQITISRSRRLPPGYADMGRWGYWRDGDTKVFVS